MDPPAMMNEGSYNFAEIWQFLVHGNGSMYESGGRLGMRGAHFGENFSQFGINREVSGDDPVRLEQKMAHGNGARKRRDVEDESAKLVSTSNGNGNGVNDSDGKRIKTSGSRDDNHSSKAEEEPSLGKLAEQNSQPPEPPKQDYIHVRARRGQATDSHSLAERARREKISERMKNLQDLVPGCNKVIGKALVLDEIINYIQSLQQQVEFLSMKLEAVNTRMNPGIEVFPPKDEMVGRYGFLFNKANYVWAVISLVNKHLILPACQLFLKLQENTTMVHHLTGCICRSEAVLKE